MQNANHIYSRRHTREFDEAREILLNSSSENDEVKKIIVDVIEENSVLNPEEEALLKDQQILKELAEE